MAQEPGECLFDSPYIHGRGTSASPFFTFDGKPRGVKMSSIKKTAITTAHAGRSCLSVFGRGGLIALVAAGVALAGTANAGDSRHMRAIDKPYHEDPEAAGEIAAAAGGLMTSADKQTALNLINAARAKPRACGSTSYPAAAPVKWNLLLEQAAQRHSDDMASHNWFSHTGTDGSTPSTRISDTGYRWYTLGENIAAGYSTVQSVIDGWLKSPGHCANIMNGRFKEIGMARQINSSSRYGSYWTLDLAASR
jgi:uncharacterized protein YkwD